MQSSYSVISAVIQLVTTTTCTSLPMCCYLLLCSKLFDSCAMKHMESIARTIISQVTWRGMCSLKSAEQIFDC